MERFAVEGKPPTEIEGVYTRSYGPKGPDAMDKPCNGTFNGMNVEHLRELFPGTAPHKFVGNPMMVNPTASVPSTPSPLTTKPAGGSGAPTMKRVLYGSA